MEQAMQNSLLIPVSDWALQAPLRGYKVQVFHSIDHISASPLSERVRIDRSTHKAYEHSEK